MKKLFLLPGLFLLGCQQGGGPITQADRDAIQQNMNGFVEAINGAHDKTGNGYTEDVISMPPHQPENVGKEKVVGFHNSTDGPKVSAFSITSQEIEGIGDMAYSKGTWTFKGTLNDSIEINDNGKYLVILKKQQDNSWKVLREIWNSDLPVPGQ